MKKYIVSLLCSSYTNGLHQNQYLTIESLLSADQDANVKTALALLETIKKVDLVSEIIDLDKKAISYDDVLKATKNIIEKKTPKKT